MNSATWKTEQFQIRARIQAAHARFWFNLFLMAWLLSGAGIFAVATNTAERKPVRGHWMIASITAQYPISRVIKTVRWKGKPYDPDVLRDWMTEQFFLSLPISGWLWWSFSLGLIPVGLGAALISRQIRKKEPETKHLRGARVIPVAELKRKLTSVGKPGISIAGVAIPEEYESHHVVVCGSSGSGKSVILRNALWQFAKRGEPCIVVDPDAKLSQEFYDSARGDIVLNPLDARCPGLESLAIAHDDVDLEALTASLFPVWDGMDQAAEFYHMQARGAYRKILGLIGKHEAREVARLVESGSKALKQAVPEKVILTLQNACRGFRYLEPGNPVQWAVREWVRNPEGWIFLSWREREEAAVLSTIALALESLSRELLSMETAPAKTIRIVIDEMASVKEQASLIKLLSRVRKFGVSVLLGFQDLQQLIAIYGRETTLSLLNQPRTKLLLSCTEPETQGWCSRVVGDREVEKTRQSETVGSENMRDSINRTPQDKIGLALLPSQFNLAPLTGYLKVGHYGVAKVSFPYITPVFRSSAFVPRRSVPQPAVVSNDRMKL